MDINIGFNEAVIIGGVLLIIAVIVHGLNIARKKRRDAEDPDAPPSADPVDRSDLFRDDSEPESDSGFNQQWTRFKTWFQNEETEMSDEDSVLPEPKSGLRTFIWLLWLIPTLALLNLDNEGGMLALKVTVFGTLGSILLFALSVPAFAAFLRNDPRDPEKTIYFFTTIDPENAKAIISGGKFVRGIMNNKDLAFSGRGRTSFPNMMQRDLWEIVEESSTVWEHAGCVIKPGFKGNPLNWFKLYTYKFGGNVFVGIPGFRQIRYYRFDRRVEKFVGDDNKTVYIPREKGTVDYTDHVIVTDFQWFINLLDVETADSIGISITTALTMKINNLHKAVFGSDLWYEIANSSTTSHIQLAFRSQQSSLYLGGLIVDQSKLADQLFEELAPRHTLSEMISENSKMLSQVRTLSGSERVIPNSSEETGETHKAGKTLDDYGMRIDALQILNPQANEKFREILEKVRTAVLEGRALAIQGAAQKTNLLEILDAARKDGGMGFALQVLDQKVKQAGAATEGTVIMDSNLPPEYGLFTKLLQDAQKTEKQVTTTET